MKTPLRSEDFGRIGDRTVPAFLLENAHGMRVRVLPIGAVIQSLEVPDAAGRLGNVVLGYPNAEDYRQSGPYFGSVVGRYANRIANGRFVIDGEVFQCPVNNGPNLLHGGPDGFHRRIWEVDADACERGRHITLRLVSEDGDQGFPGRLDVSASYRLNDTGTLSIDYQASTDQPTIVNLSQHTYFNLAGEASGSAMDHLLRLNASAYTPVDEQLIPTGEVVAVADTPFDFRQSRPIGETIRAAHPQILITGGFDHNFVIDRQNARADELVEVASIIEPRSGRTLLIASTEPGVQFYSGNFLHGHDVGSSGRVYRQGDGIALETQHFPDSPNQPSFPSTILRPGETFRSTTTWTFGCE